MAPYSKEMRREILAACDRGEGTRAVALRFRCSDATGYYGQTFVYDESPNYLGSTELLKDFDTYKIGLYVDFALTALTLQGAAVGPTGAIDIDGDVDGADFLKWQRGESPNGGDALELADWTSNFGVIGLISAASAGVPELSTLALLSCALVGSRWRRRGQRRESQ